MAVGSLGHLGYLAQRFRSVSCQILFHGRKLTMKRYSPLLDEDTILLFYLVVPSGLINRVVILSESRIYPLQLAIW